MEIENKIDPNGKTRTDLTFFNEEIFTNPGPMGCNMYPKIKRIKPNGYRQDSIDAFGYCINDWTKAKQEYDRMVRASWNIKPAIVDVIFNGPATIVFWSDETKTIVKCAEDDKFDREKGLAMAIAKKLLGNEGNYYNEFKKWLPEENLPDMVIKE